MTKEAIIKEAWGIYIDKVRYFNLEDYDYFRHFSTHYQPIIKPQPPIY